MAFHIRDPATDRAVRRLANLTGKTLREAVERRACAASACLPDCMHTGSGCPSVADRRTFVFEAGTQSWTGNHSVGSSNCIQSTLPTIDHGVMLFEVKRRS